MYNNKAIVSNDRCKLSINLHMGKENMLLLLLLLSSAECYG